MIYLATPYFHKQKTIRLERVNKSIAETRRLMKLGYNVYNPLSYSMPYQETEFYWKKHGIQMLKKCSLLVIHKIQGWETSTGIKDEIKTAEKFKIEIIEYKIIKEYYLTQTQTLTI